MSEYTVEVILCPHIDKDQIHAIARMNPVFISSYQ